MIEAEALSLSYGRTRALVEATFEVRPGEVLGLLGPNGAGKSTTLKILTTYLRPDTGRVVVDGVDTAEDPVEVRRRIGYLPETAPLYGEMLVSEYLAFCGRARGLAGAALGRRREAVVESCSLEPVYNRPIAHLSKGFRQRVGLAQALIHDPPVLVLDEPTSGLDPLQILGIRELVRELAASKTVVFSTHILQEIAAISDRVMILDRGRVVATGTPDELQRRAMGEDRLLVEAEGRPSAIEAVLRGLDGVVAVEPVARPEDARALEGDTPVAAFHVHHDFDDGTVGREVGRALVAAGHALRRLEPQRYSLERVFIELTSGVPGTGEAGAAGEPAGEEPVMGESATGESATGEPAATDEAGDGSGDDETESEAAGRGGDA